LLAQRAESVIAVDNAPKMVEFGARLAQENVLRTWSTAGRSGSAAI